MDVEPSQPIELEFVEEGEEDEIFKKQNKNQLNTSANKSISKAELLNFISSKNNTTKKSTQKDMINEDISIQESEQKKSQSVEDLEIELEIENDIFEQPNKQNNSQIQNTIEEVSSDNLGNKIQKLDLKEGDLLQKQKKKQRTDGYQVYETFTCMLNLTDISYGEKGHNKFYQIEVLHKGYSIFTLYTKWGRVGAQNPQESYKRMDNKYDAILGFKKKFYDKTHNDWTGIFSDFKPQPGKYTWIQVDASSGGSKNSVNEDIERINKRNAELKKRMNSNTSKLESSIKDLMLLIWDFNRINKTLKELNFDTEKNPLGRLTFDQVQKGYKILTEIQNALLQGSRTSIIIELTNQFYTNIPQNYGMRALPMIDHMTKVKEKLHLLDVLKEIDITRYMNQAFQAQGAESINPLDTFYSMLKCNINQVDQQSQTYQVIQKMVENTHGPSHEKFKLKIVDIYELNRNQESQRFFPFKQLPNQTLLWHGSRISNFVGILSEGLRIAPPEAPMTGYMFGKGIYMADVVSKAAVKNKEMLQQLPKRPPKSSAQDISKICKNIKLLTNMFTMQVEAPQSSDSDEPQGFVNKVLCHQYDVEFSPSIAEDNRNLRYKIFKEARRNIEQIIGKFSFSGKSLFSMRNLSKEKINKIKNIDAINVDGQKFSILLRFTKTFEVNDESAQNLDKTSPNFKKGNQVTQLLNIILKSIMRDEKFQEIGKNSKFYNVNSRNEIVIKGRDGNTSALEAYKGFTFNVTPTQDKLYLMVDYCSRIIRKETALEYLKNNNNQLSGLSVITKYNNYQTYLIDRVDGQKTPSSTFLNSKTNTQISFAQYYKERYNIQIRDMRQPLLVHKRKYREANTNIQKVEEVYLIPEICNMTGMTDEQRENFQAMKEVATHTKLTPQERYQNSVNNCRFLSSKTSSSGIRIDERSNLIDAVQLRAPKVTLGGNKTANTDRGNFDMRAPTLDKIEFKDWTLIYNQKDERSVDGFIDTLKKASQTYGITVNDPFFFAQRDWNANSWIKSLDEDFSKNDLPQFVLSFGQAQSGLYSGLKKFLTSEAGIESQHVNPRSLQKNGMSVASKIALQIASKLGRRIWQVETPTGIDKNTMIIGIETSMKKIKQQQVVGVVASIDKDFTKYFSDVEIRKDNDTTLPTLSKIVTKAIQAYVKNTKSVPAEVIVYRQGLGEGQIQQSCNLEIKAIQNGFSNFKSDFNPRLAFFQVNRKIGQKFYQSPQGDKGEVSNPASGTIVASQVVQNNFEFFMAAQNCNSGVCTPTKYTCLYNNTNLKEDQIWQLTYYQTFNYYNWQGPVRVPAAMKYAEKLAKFVSDTIQEAANENLTNSLFYL